MVKKVGYARVSTTDQSLDLQIKLLETAGCDVIFQDYGVSGTKMQRRRLSEALKTLNKGDYLVVWRLDRLSRSLSGIIHTIDWLAKNNIEFVSLAEGFDTTTIGGMLVLPLIAGLADFDQNVISERTKARSDTTTRRGKRLGRPPALTSKQLDRIRDDTQKNIIDYKALADEFGVSIRTIYRAAKNLCANEYPNISS